MVYWYSRRKIFFIWILNYFACFQGSFVSMDNFVWWSRNFHRERCSQTSFIQGKPIHGKPFDYFFIKTLIKWGRTIEKLEQFLWSGNPLELPSVHNLELWDCRTSHLRTLISVAGFPSQVLLLHLSHWRSPFASKFKRMSQENRVRSRVRMALWSNWTRTMPEAKVFNKVFV